MKPMPVAFSPTSEPPLLPALPSLPTDIVSSKAHSTVSKIHATTFVRFV